MIETNGKVINFTLADVADNIEKNGLPRYEGWYFDSMYEPEDGYSYIVAACALGQAMINIGVDNITGGWGMDEILNRIPEWNDGLHLSFKEIADKIRIEYRDYLNSPLWGARKEYKVKS
jgi:hypothetical protein